MMTIFLTRSLVAHFLVFASGTLGPWLGAAVPAQDVKSCQEMVRRLGLPIHTMSYHNYDGYFVVDTGASRSLIFGGDELLSNADETWVVSRPTEGNLISGVAHGTYVSNMRLAVFGKPPSASTVFLWSKSSPGWKSPPPGLSGAIGLPQLRTESLHINLRTSVCELADVPRKVDPSESSVSLQISILDKTEVPVEFSMRGGKTHVQLDTGFRGHVILPTRYLELLERSGDAVRFGTTTIRAAGNAKVQQFVIRSVKLGEFEFHDVPVVESSVYAIATGILSHFDAVMDFREKQLRLTPLSDEWPKRVPPDASGLLLMYMDENDLKIDVVEEGSAAAKVGLSVEDRILLCDGKEPKDWSMLDLRERLSEGGTKLPLRIRRGEKEFDLILPLVWQFEYPPKWPPRDQQVEKFEKFLEEQREKEKARSKQ